MLYVTITYIRAKTKDVYYVYGIFLLWTPDKSPPEAEKPSGMTVLVY